MLDPFTMMMASTGLSSLIGAGSSIFGSMTSAKTQQHAIDAMSQMFGVAREDIQSMFQTGKLALDPFVSAGAGTLDALKSLLVPGPDMNRTLEQLPGYQFMRDQGLLGITNAGTVRGLGGNVARAGADYASGLAKSSWGDLVSKLEDLAKTGETAASQEAGLAGQMGGALGNLGGRTAEGIGQAMIGKGSVEAAGITGAGGALAGGISNIGTYAMLDKFMGGKMFGGGDQTQGYAPPGTNFGAVPGAQSAWVNPDLYPQFSTTV